MEFSAAMIGAAGNCTFSAVVWQDGNAHFYSETRVFAYPDPAITIPPGTKPKYELTVNATSQQEAIQAVERALAAQIGELRWVRWRFASNDAQKPADS
jgi:hypothetical protein